MSVGSLCKSESLAAAMKTGSGSEVRAYALAVFFCFVAGVLAWVLDAPSSCFILALIAANLFCGRGPAFLAIFLSSCAFEFVYLPPAFHILHSRASLVRMGFFVAVMVVSQTILEAKRRSDMERMAIGEEFRSLAETSPDAIFIAGKDSTLIFANPAMLTMFRRPRREVLGTTAEQLLPGFNTLAVSGEFVAIDADGRQFYVDATCGQFGNKTTVFLRDISDRKAAEEKLKKSEESLRLTLETIPGLVYTCTPEGAIEYANEQVSAYLGKTLAEVQKGAWDEALQPEERRRVIDQRHTWFAAGRTHTTEYRLRRFDGIFRSYQTTVRPLTDDGGRIIRWYGVLTDIEERRQAEDSLRRTETKLAKSAQKAAISELAAAVVHEISQPLSAMVANGQACLRWLASTPPNTADGRASVERIVRDGKDAAEIVRGLRSLFRDSALEKTKLDLRIIVSEVASLLRERVQREHIRLEIDLPPDLPAIEGDKIQLQQVLMNLLGNSIDALRDTVGPRCVIVRARQQSAMVFTEVIDNGASPPDFDTIFDPFVTTKAEGMGMGLSICRSIIKAHEGQLGGEARADGGTVFSFTLPCLTESIHES
jgi:PAS domain S-box-containing protein